MNTANNISDRMAKIRSIHEDAQLFAGTEFDDDILIAYLETTDAWFRSIAYEGAAMSRGLLDISQGHSLAHWIAYMERTTAHSVQVHIGLGWALSQRQVPILSTIHDLLPIAQARVIDGCGYYEGMFRNRTSIRDKTLPEEIKGTDLHAYDQGIGRSLWYISKGNATQLQRLIEGFSADRKPDIWRGVGIAAAYVGALDESMLTSLFNLAASYQIQLASGAVFLTHSRVKAGTFNPESNLACLRWCHLSADEAVSLMNQTEPTPGDPYVKWTKAIEDGIQKALAL